MGAVGCGEGVAGGCREAPWPGADEPASGWVPGPVTWPAGRGPGVFLESVLEMMATMDAGVKPHHLRYFDLEREAETGGDVTSAAEVAAKADEVAAAYRDDPGFGHCPGLTLMRGAGVPEDSLSICVAPDRWAVIHYEDYCQTITHSDREPTGVCESVFFDDVLEIPAVCFIDRSLALEVIEAWMSGGGLLESAGFSDDLFTC